MDSTDVLLVWVMGLVTMAAVWGLRMASKYLERKPRSPAAGEEIAHFAERLERLEAQREGDAGIEQRLTELEERLDFAERLLAQGREAPRVRGGA